jgi:hypothetical protein
MATFKHINCRAFSFAATSIKEISPIFVIVAHLLLTFPIFSPFLLKGMNIYGSTDNKFAFFVHFFLNLKSLKEGDLNLWNPYILSGIDFTTSTHNYMFSPLNWLLMLVPEEHFFTAFTLRVMVEIWLIGVFGFLAFNAILGSRKWAFFASVTYQLGSLVFLGITLYPATTTLLLSTIAIYLLFTIDKRKLYISYFLLSIDLATLFLSGQIVYMFYMTLNVFILYLFKTLVDWNWTKVKLILQYWSTFILSVITSILIGSLRLLPIHEGIKESARIYGNIRYLGMKDLIPYHYFAFVPETFSLNFGSSIPILDSIGYGGHIHGSSSYYLGIVPILMIVWAIVAVRNSKPIAVLSIVYLTIWLWLINVQPVALIFNAVLFPFIHTLAAMYLLPTGICLLVGYIGKYIEENIDSINRENIIATLSIGAIILGGTLGVWLYIYPDSLTQFKLFVFLVFLIGFTCYLFPANNLHLSNHHKKILLSFIIFIISLTLSVLFIPLLKNFNTLFLSSPSAPFKFSVTYTALSIIGICGILIGLLFYLRDHSLKYKVMIGTNTVILAIVVVVMLPFSGIDRVPTLPESAILFSMGAFRSIVGALFLTVLLLSLKSGKLKPQLLMPLLLLVVLVDLLPFNKSYSRIITEPFFAGNSLYPARENILKNLNIPLGYELMIKERNLLINHNFVQINEESGIPDGWINSSTKAFFKTQVEKSNQKFNRSLNFINQENKITNLYQNIANPEKFAEKTLTLGAWIKASVPNSVRLALNDRVAGQTSAFHSGNGEWEWLETSLKINQNPSWVRSHISVTGSTPISIAETILVEIHPEASIVIDTENYRVNHAHVVLGLSGSEMETNIPTYYGVRTYGGVNSTITKQYSTFVRNFDQNNQPLQGSVANILTNDRFLDLVGVRYDVDASSYLKVRPNALSRFMLFSNFETIEDQEKALPRLKEPTFNPQESIILAKSPNIPSSIRPKRGKFLKAVKQTASRVELEVNSEDPAILFFDDSYDQGWKVYVNGKSQEIIPANYQFMATALAAGKSQVVFKFEPSAFTKALLLAKIGIFMLLSVSIIGYSVSKIKALELKKYD